MRTIGIIKEGKTPPDRRVPFTPEQCRQLEKQWSGTKVIVERSDIRCFPDSAYEDAGLVMSNDISDCDIIMGVKEVPLEKLFAGKIYFFFSHTIKEQPYNRELLQTVLNRNICLVDYETLTDERGLRLLGFGRWAGIVGAYNGLYAWGHKTGAYTLKRAYKCSSRSEMDAELEKVTLPPGRIVLTGGGRVANGAMETLDKAGIRRVDPDEFLLMESDSPVYCPIDADVYCRHRDGLAFNFSHFFAHPQEYESAFAPFTCVADMHIACHYWDPASPLFYAAEDMARSDFRIRLVADISCDIDGPIASTLRASSIREPLYGYNPKSGEEAPFEDSSSVGVMAVDNLPCELPKEASADFGQTLLEKVMPCLLGEDRGGVIARACIAADGRLMPAFKYLEGYAGV
ncbi:MAG: NAD(P)-dependent oxidoreductase [Flavobacteriales bacterium]